MRIWILLFVALTLPLSLQAQDAVREAFDQAIALVEKDDVAGAITRLESQRQRGDLPFPYRSLLGALYQQDGRAEAALEILGPLAEETEDAAVLYHAAKSSQALGLGEQAKRYFERSYRKNQSSPAARELGMLYLAAGDEHDAYRYLLPWARAHPEEEDRVRDALELALRLNRTDEAAELAPFLPMGNPRNRLLRGEVMVSRGDLPEALALLDPMMESPPPEIEADLRSTIAYAAFLTGRSERAVEALEGHTGTDPGSILLLSQAYHRQGKVEEAISTLAPLSDVVKARHEQPPNSIPERRFMASVALESGRFLLDFDRVEDAVEYLEISAGLDPRVPEVWQLLAQALRVAGRVEEGAKAAERFEILNENAVAPASSNPIERALRAAAVASQGEQHEAAARLLRREIELSGPDPRLFAAQIVALLRAGELDEGLAAAEEFVRFTSENADALYARGLIYLARENRGAAERDFRNALAKFPDHISALNDLAVLLILDGRRIEAAELLRRVLELRPDDILAADNLRRLESRSAAER